MKKEVKQKRKSKKGISPLIATVLLVAIVVAAAGAVYVWSKGFIAERIMKFEKPAETVCQEIKIEASITGIGQQKLTINNKGNLNIANVQVRRARDGNLKTLELKDKGLATHIMPGDIGVVTTTGTEIIQKNDKVEVVPMIMGKGTSSGKNKLYLCEDNIYKFKYV